jgi:hypothetical protein
VSRGRPIIGPTIKVAMPQDLLARVDSKRGRRSRAAYIRDAVATIAGTVGGGSDVSRQQGDAMCVCGHLIRKHGLEYTGAGTRERGACTLCPCKLARVVAVVEEQ